MAPPSWLLVGHVAKSRGRFLALLLDSVGIFMLISHTCEALGGHTCAVCVFVWCLLYKATSQLWAKLAITMFRELPEAESSECLGSMTPETQDIYLRMDHHRRRSGYRLGRIIARQQLLRRIAAGN